MTELAPGTTPDWRWRQDGAIVLAIVGLVALTYGGVWSHQFVAWDDDAYISRNANMLQGLSFASLRWALTANVGNNWHPLTLWSHLADVSLWGSWAGGYALGNVLIHALNSVLLYAIFRWLTGDLWRSAALAALFALHPLHVESVAWISERKDVLSGLFWLLTMAAYAQYGRVGGKSGIGFYFLVALCMVLAMLAKPMAIMLPVALVCMDLWPLGRVKPAAFTAMAGAVLRLAVEKLPWFALALALLLITVLAQGKAVVADYPAGMRLMTVINGYTTYLGQTFWPVDLHFYYLTENVQRPLMAALGGGVLLAVSAFAWRARNHSPALLAGWLWFLLTLLPVIGIVKAGTQATADRYHYLPSIGLFAALIWGLPWSALIDRLPGGKKAAGALAIVLVAAMAVLSARQVATWQNSETLFSHAIAVEPNHYVALIRLAGIKQQQGQVEASEALVARALAWSASPAVQGAGARIRGLNASQRGDLAQAGAFYATAIEREADNPENYFLFGTSQLQSGNFARAEAALRKALAILPTYGDAWLNLGAALARQGRFAEALQAHRAAVAGLPPNFRLKLILVQRMIDAGRVDEARKEIGALATLHPADTAEAAWLKGLAQALGMAGGAR